MTVSRSRTSSVRAFVSLRPSAISAWTVNEYDPAPAGRPVITPSPAPSVRPAGRLPETIDQVFASGRLAVIAAMYGVPTVAGETNSGPMISLGSGGGGSVPGLMVIDTCSSELSALLQVSWSGSFSSNQKANVPA